jgi:hypothetical protein
VNWLRWNLFFVYAVKACCHVLKTHHCPVSYVTSEHFTFLHLIPIRYVLILLFVPRVHGWFYNYNLDSYFVFPPLPNEFYMAFPIW